MAFFQEGTNFLYGGILFFVICGGGGPFGCQHICRGIILNIEGKEFFPDLRGNPKNESEMGKSKGEAFQVTCCYRVVSFYYNKYPLLRNTIQETAGTSFGKKSLN